MLDKYFYALGRGISGARAALRAAQANGNADPASAAKDVTPAGVESGGSAPGRTDWQRAPAAASDIEDAMLVRGPLVTGQRPLVMGIVNVTPDSFSDGGHFIDPMAAVSRAMQLAREGADILDIGGESTRPGATPVGEEEELARVAPVVAAIAARTSLPISIDTMKANVARAAIAAGATIINDVWGFQRDRDMASVAAETGVHCVLMHNRQADQAGGDIFAEVRDFLLRSIEIALAAGVAREKIIVDPGIGFGIDAEQGFTLIRRLGELKSATGCPVLLGVSRKRLIGVATGRTIAAERDTGSVAAALYGALHGADIVRAHDVRAHVEAFGVLAAIEGRPAVIPPGQKL